MDEPRSDLDAQGNRNQPEHSPRVWRACCLVPTLAVALIFIIAIGASLRSPSRRMFGGPPQPTDAASKARREAFISFGKAYFGVIQKAEQANQTAFEALQSKVQGNGSLETVHSTFRTAAGANARAAAELKALSIPQNLRSQDKIQASINSVSQSFLLRRDVCMLLVAWNGDTKDQRTVDKYNSLAEKVNSLTRDGLTQLADAARDNQVTQDDARKFLPSSESMRMGAAPWQPE